MVTVKEIAAAANCSPSTVSIVLSGKAKERNISQATQQRVMDVAASMNYRTNIAARSLREGSGSNEIQVALFWAQDFRASMMVRFWDGLRQEVESSHNNIRLVIIPYTNGHLKDSHALTSNSGCHAAIICNASDEDLEFLESAILPIPVVLYNRFCSKYSSVNVDDYTMGELAAKALISQGCSSLAVLAGHAVFEGMNVRISGFVSEAEKQGLSPSVHGSSNGMCGGHNAVLDLLSRGWKGLLPDGIFCASSMIAHGAIRAFREAGVMQLPKIVAIGNGMDDHDRSSTPSLSVIHMPMEDMAKECLRLLLDIIQDKAAPRRVMLDIKYIDRESCGPILA